MARTRETATCARWCATLLVLCMAVVPAAHAAPGPEPCSDLVLRAAVEQTLDLSGQLCDEPGLPVVGDAAGPGVLAGATFRASASAVGTFTATLTWPDARRQRVTIEVMPGVPVLRIGAPRCTASGRCVLRARISRPRSGTIPRLVVQRRSIDDRWAVYERIDVPASSNVEVRVSAGSYRAVLVVGPGAVNVAARSAVAVWRQRPIAVAEGRGTWPIQPRDHMHAIRNGFMDARGTNYHHGVDIFIDDSRPETGAPAWASHRVYAITGGAAGYQSTSPPQSGSSCTRSRTAVGPLIYYHMVPTVRPGSQIAAGQMIGWTCRGRWHMHVTEGFGANPANPLRPGAQLLRPYIDDVPPKVEEMGPWSACDGRWMPWSAAPHIPAAEGIPPCGHRLDPTDVRGLVDVRFRVFDDQPRVAELDEHPWMRAPLNPYGADVRVDRLDASGVRGENIFARRVFRADHLDGQPAFTVLWAPGFRRWQPLWVCARMRVASRCAGAHWYRAFGGDSGVRYWDTRAVPDGRYRVTVIVIDHGDNRVSARVDLTVHNGARAGARAGMRIEQPDGPEGPVLPHGDPLAGEDTGDELELAYEGCRMYRPGFSCQANRPVPVSASPWS